MLKEFLKTKVSLFLAVVACFSFILYSFAVDSTPRPISESSDSSVAASPGTIGSSSTNDEREKLCGNFGGSQIYDSKSYKASMYIYRGDLNRYFAQYKVYDDNGNLKGSAVYLVQHFDANAPPVIVHFNILPNATGILKEKFEDLALTNDNGVTLSGSPLVDSSKQISLTRPYSIPSPSVTPTSTISSDETPTPTLTPDVSQKVTPSSSVITTPTPPNNNGNNSTSIDGLMKKILALMAALVVALLTLAKSLLGK